MPDTYNRTTQIEKDAEYRSKVDMLMKTIYGNGQPGLIDEVAETKSALKSFYDRWFQREEDKKQYDNRSSARQMILLGLATLILGLLAFFGIRAQIDRAHAFISMDKQTQQAENGTTHAVEPDASANNR